MSTFFFGNNFYKCKETFKIFSSQLLEVYRVLSVETILESIIFYYTISFTILCSFDAPLYDSTTATRTLKLCTTLLSIYCGNHLISLLMMPSFFLKLCLSGTPSENSQEGWDLGNRIARGYLFYAKCVCPMESYAWGIQVFCLRNEAPPHFSNRTHQKSSPKKNREIFVGHPVNTPPRNLYNKSLIINWMTALSKILHFWKDGTGDFPLH